MAMIWSGAGALWIAARSEVPSTVGAVASQAALYPEHPMREYAQIAPLALRGDASAAVACFQPERYCVSSICSSSAPRRTASPSLMLRTVTLPGMVRSCPERELAT